MTGISSRISVLQALGATGRVIDELLEYNENHFDQTAVAVAADDEPFVSTWEAYVREAERAGAYPCLLDKLMQLRFPIRRGISASSEYAAAIRRGEPPTGGEGLELKDPDNIRIELHQSAGGRIPLIVVTNRSDFVTLVQALARRNEPERIPSSMGACMISGYTNWDRVRRCRREWESTHPGDRWAAEFHHFAARKHLYQDRFIILSDGPYSGISAKEMGLPDDVWRSISLIIRREHECAHYFTRRLLGSMRNNLLDEIIADYMGIVEVCGRFRADWLLRFMGLASYPVYRDGGRFENYVGTLSDAAIAVLRDLVVRAAARLEQDDLLRVFSISTPAGKARVLRRLTSLTLEEMASSAFVPDEFAPAAPSPLALIISSKELGNPHCDHFLK